MVIIMKRQTATFILLSMLTAQMVACGDTSGDVETTLSNDEDTTVAEVDMSSTCELPDIKWEGREFRVLGRKDSQGRTQFDNFEIYAECENGELVNDAVFKRNSRIQEKYDVKITQTLVDQPHTELKKLILAQEDAYDIAFVNFASIGTLAAEGYLYDLNTVDYIDFSKSYWNPDVNESLTIGDSLYFTSSDFSLQMLTENSK